MNAFQLGAGLALVFGAAACNSAADSGLGPPISAASPTVEELFEVGPMPAVASGAVADAWMAYCVATATGYEIELRDSPEGGISVDMTQPGYDDERWMSAGDYCVHEGDVRGYYPEPTRAERQADFEKHVVANTCLVEQGIDQPAVPSTLEEYESSPWHPFATAPMRSLGDEEYERLYRLCLGDERISFVDWEP